jgi:hypothetical protein
VPLETDPYLFSDFDFTVIASNFGGSSVFLSEEKRPARGRPRPDESSIAAHCNWKMSSGSHRSTVAQHLVYYLPFVTKTCRNR